MYAENHSPDFGGNKRERAQGGKDTRKDQAITLPSVQLKNMTPTASAILEICGQWNATDRVYDTSQCVPQLIEHRAQKTPDALALTQKNRTYTYAELNAKANQLARYLRTQGIGPDVLVSVCMDRSPELIICFLAVLKAGGAYVPMDPAHPIDRLVFMLNDTQSPIILTTNTLAQQLSGVTGKLLSIDATEQPWLAESYENLAPLACSNNLAYVIYTSGSTGQPKGAEVTHANLLNLIFWHQDYFKVTENDRSSQCAGLSFDVTVDEIWPYLACGASLHLVPDEDTRMTPELLRDWLINQHITISLLPTAVAERVITLPWPSQAPLRYILTGGDDLHQQPSTGAPFTLINNYGLTETTVIATCDSVPQQGAGKPPFSIGYPIANTKVYLLDEQLQPVPIGEKGEIYIGGASVARGYHNRPELTKERFIENPFASQPGTYLYKTGDIGRYQEDGRLIFLGRVDSQVKIRGYRIELGEIEQVMLTHPDVRDAIVLAREDRPGGKYLIAYAVPRKGVQLTATELRAFVGEHVPHYMVPTDCIIMESFPLTINGKVDRKALPQPHTQPASPPRIGTDSTEWATLTLIQIQLLQLWEELLGRKSLSIYDNFFTAGGHSLLATQMLKRIEETWNVKIPYTTLFAQPTIAQLAEAIQQHEEHRHHASVYTIQAAQPGRNQKPFFFLHGDWTGGAFYCYTISHICGKEQPFYALDTYAFTIDEPVPTLPELAAAHIEVLKEEQPAGPYMIGGFCNGGLLAYEMGKQLRADGERVDELLLVTPTSADMLPFLRQFVRLWKWLFGKSRQRQIRSYLRLRHALRHLYRLIRPQDRHLSDFQRLVTLDPRLAHMFPPLEALFNDYVGIFSWLAAEYDINQPPFYSDQTTFVWANNEPAIQRSWQKVISNKTPQTIKEYHLSGTHMSCVTDNIIQLAKIIDLQLRRRHNKQK